MNTNDHGGPGLGRAIEVVRNTRDASHHANGHDGSGEGSDHSGGGERSLALPRRKGLRLGVLGHGSSSGCRKLKAGRANNIEYR
jgi:hypothetical protein